MIDEGTSFDAGMRPRRAWRGWLIALLLAFVLGAVGTLAAIRHWPALRDRTIGAPAVRTQLVRVPVPVTPAASATVATGAIAGLDERVSTIENRIDDVDERARAAMGDAGRAEGLLLAVAARRALDQGMPLGYLEGMIRTRFGAAHAREVATILSAARQPVTLDALRTGLDAAAPNLATGEANAGWWSSLRAQLSSLVVVRRTDTPSAAPPDRVARAQRLLADGRVDQALAEVARLPARGQAAGWIVSARRYVGARQALEAIETAALLEPAPEELAAPAPTSIAGDAQAGGAAVELRATR